MVTPLHLFRCFTGMRTTIWPSALGYLAGLRRNGGRRVGVRVYNYHGIVERKTDPLLERNLHLLRVFREHVAFLRNFPVLSLPELADVLASRSMPRRPMSVLTFDDGYRNNLIAAEILAEAGLPWGVFVSTGPVGRGGTIWTVELSLLILQGRSSQVDTVGRVWDLSTRDRREEAFHAIRRVLKASSAPLRREALEAIRVQFPAGETERLLNMYPSLAMMSWEEVGLLSRSGVEVGSHGVEHEIHHGDQTESVRKNELIYSKDELERLLARPCRFFAYPNGDAHAASVSLVAQHYQLAFTTQPGTVIAGQDPCQLPRMGPPGSLREFARRFFWRPART